MTETYDLERYNAVLSPATSHSRQRRMRARQYLLDHPELWRQERPRFRTMARMLINSGIYPQDYGVKMLADFLREQVTPIPRGAK